MNKNFVEDLKDWFVSYVQPFKSGNADQQQNIILKEEHTKRVCKEILDIGKELGLTDKDLCLAEIIALLHDIGRFEQYARYQTFADRDSVDHAAFGVKILQENGVLNKLDKPMQSLILRTISYHNRRALPQQESATCLFFSKLLRDADKLDIWRVVTDYYYQKDEKRNNVIELGLPDTPEISCDVYKDLMDGRIVDVTHLKNLNDFKLLQIGWIYDVNFTPTFQRVRDRRYLEMIRDVLPKSNKIEEIFSVIQSYLDDKIQNKQEKTSFKILSN
ncbi:MAG: HD domain-containing protein [Deltaproteobacteria bacterium]|nr:HD domain-containing protein [Deltaproteobacteria bacterium]